MMAHTTIRSKARNTAAFVAVLLSLAWLGCGGSKSQNGGAANADGTVQVRGRISVRGSSPGALVMLEGNDGRLYVIQSSRIGDELSRLAGMDVEIEAVRLPELGGEDETVLAVRWYDLLTLPTGERPIVGYVDASADAVWIRDQSETVWIIVGSFEDVFRSFGGYKVWVTGVTTRTLDTAQYSTRNIQVTDYGVLRP